MINTQKIIPIVLALSLILSYGCEEKKTYNKNGIYYGIKTEKNFNKIEEINKTLKKTEKKPNIIATTLNWEESVPEKKIKYILQYDAIPLILWEPWIWNELDSISSSDILNGLWDSYITEFAKKIFELEYPIMIALAPTPNKKGYAWSVNEKNPPINYIQVKKYIENIFEKEGANNTIWILFLEYTNLKNNFQKTTSVYSSHTNTDWIGINITNISKNKIQFNKNIKELHKKIEKRTHEKPTLVLINDIKKQSEQINYWLDQFQHNTYKKPYCNAILIEKTDTIEFDDKIADHLNTNLFNANIDNINEVHLEK